MSFSLNERPKILIVDDVEANLLALDTLLSKRTFDVIWSRSGKAALEIAERTELALIILDIQMPEMDGFTVAQQLKKYKISASTPIIFATAGEHNYAHELKAYQVGAVDIIFKPIDPSIFEAKVQVFIDMWKAKQPKQDFKESIEHKN